MIKNGKKPYNKFITEDELIRIFEIMKDYSSQKRDYDTACKLENVDGYIKEYFEKNKDVQDIMY